jgi:glutathione S-transferase
MYHVYGTTRTRAARVLWLLEELGAPYQHHDLGPQSPEVLALNPSGKVPVLTHKDLVLTDSTAILTHLADTHAAFTHPPGTTARAQQDALTFLILDEFDACLWTAARHSFVLPPEHRLPAIKDSLRWEFDRSCSLLVPRLQGPFLMGEVMTIPDIILAHCLLWAIVARFPLSEPALLDYFARMRARPAFRRALPR